MPAFLDSVHRSRIVGIIRVDDLSHAIELSQALFDGGLILQEFTLTNPDAVSAISKVRQTISAFQKGDAFVGAGSIRNVDQAEQAIQAGAQFIVTPIFRRDVIEYCRSQRIPVLPGAYTPTEIADAWEAGADLVKVFPARNLGTAYIKDVLAPMPHLKLMPTGGIDLSNLRDFLSCGAAAVGVGGSLVDPNKVRDRNWDALSQTAAAYVEAAREISL